MFSDVVISTDFVKNNSLNERVDVHIKSCNLKKECLKVKTGVEK